MGQSTIRPPSFQQVLTIISSLEVRFLYHEPMERTHPRSLSGGTAGNVVANRLTEDINIQVLVLEAGGR